MKNLLLLLLFFACAEASAQRFTVLSGKLENLKGIAAYNITFDYKGLEVNGFASEAAYLEEKVGKRQNYSDGGQKAQKFEQDWYADREGKYEPAFIEYFNKRFEKGEVKVLRDPSQKYTMTVKTTWVYPGYALAQVEPAKISAVITIAETANPANVLVALEFDKSIGVVKDKRDQGDRIAGAYERLAKNLTIQLKRFL